MKIQKVLTISWWYQLIIFPSSIYDTELHNVFHIRTIGPPFNFPSSPSILPARSKGSWQVCPLALSGSVLQVHWVSYCRSLQICNPRSLFIYTGSVEVHREKAFFSKHVSASFRLSNAVSFVVVLQCFTSRRNALKFSFWNSNKLSCLEQLLSALLQIPSCVWNTKMIRLDCLDVTVSFKSG